jgi:hypothetical protein
MLTATAGGGAFTVTVADAALALSATLVALTVKLPGLLGAVYIPLLVMLPPVADHETPVLLVPVTVAMNCCVSPVCSETELGLTATETGGGGGGSCEELDAVTPQPALASARVIAANNSNRRTRG